jgi:hypothetical protein
MPERVDEWDDEVAPVHKPDAPAPSVPVASVDTAPAESPAPLPADGTADGEDDTDRPIPWRQAIRGAPTWVWLIAIVSIGSICVMMSTVVLLFAILK